MQKFHCAERPVRPRRQFAETTRGLLVLATALLTLGGVPGAPGAETAEAGGGLRANVYLVQRALPRRASERALLRFARAHHSSRLQETHEPDPEDRAWEANLVVHFSRPPGDLEFHVLFYDTQDGAPRFVDDMAVYLNARDQRTYVQRLRLPRPKFKPERRMELVVTVGRKEVARRSFQLRGERRRNTGEVVFSEEEARRGVGEEGEPQRVVSAEPPSEPEPIPEAEEEVTVDTDAVGAAEDMELPEAPASADAPPAVSPSAAGRRGGLCSLGALPASEGLPLAASCLVLLAWLLFRSRPRRAGSSAHGVRRRGLLG